METTAVRMKWKGTLVAGLLFTSSALGQDSNPGPGRCSKAFAQLTDTATQAALWLPRQQTRYWKEVFKECKELPRNAPFGPLPTGKCAALVAKRLVMVERNPRDKRKFQLDMILNPVALIPEIFKTKYQFSAPANFLLSIPGTALAFSALDVAILDTASNYLSEFAGGSYLAAMAASGLVSGQLQDTLLGASPVTIALNEIRHHEENLSRWETSGGKPEHLPRLKEILDWQIVSSGEDLQRLNQLAFKAYRSAKKKPGRFDQLLAIEFRQYLDHDSEFSEYPEETKQILSMLLLPPLTIEGQSDFALIARIFGYSKDKKSSLRNTDPLGKLRPVALDTPLPSLLFMATETLQNPEEIAKKQKSWQELGQPGAAPPFVTRPDIPEVRQALRTLQSKLAVELPDELAVWKLIWTDPRFSDLKLAFKTSQRSEIEVLTQAIGRVSQ